MPANWNVIGHEWAVALLKGQIENGRLRHAYLFTGPAGVGRRTLALRLAQALNCTHPPTAGEFCGECRPCRGFAASQHADLLLLKRLEDEREIKVDAIRELRRDLSRTPLEVRVQVALLLHFEEANEEASNALLKTLEEPNPSVLLCLTSLDADHLPTTIVSRCELLRLKPVPVEQLASGLQEAVGLGFDEARWLASLSNGLPGKALRLHRDPLALEQRAEWLESCEQLLSANRVQRFTLAEKISKDREALRGRLLVWLSFWRDVFLQLSQVSAPLSNPDKVQLVNTLAASVPRPMVRKSMAAIERALENLSTNVNARLAMENLLLELPIIA